MNFHDLKRTACAIAVLALASASAVTLWGHHSFAMFDTSNLITLSGKVTEFEWTNPHAYIELDVTDQENEVQHWTIELGSPSILMQAGWKFNDLKPGDEISATVNPLRNGDPGGLLGRVTLPDGRVLSNGPGR
jgi:hypothetical protein